jgi:hypothetical protein
MLPAGPLNPFDWIDDGADGSQQQSLMRGTGGALAYWQKRQISGPQTIAQAGPIYLQSRPYSRGAERFSPKFGVLNINPIGAGVYAPYRIPTISGPGARYEFAAIWFDVQTIPTSIAPSPTMSMNSVAALLATSSVAGMYATTG